MKLGTCSISLSLGVALVAAVAGCSKSGAGAVHALEPAKIPAAVNGAFSHASADARQDANNYVAALQNQDPAAAFTRLQKIRSRQDLTAEQRSVVIGALQTTFKQMQAAAQNGNHEAQAAMHQYLSTR